jgi:hypothetical protein
MKAENIRKRFLWPPLSAIAPNTGADTATTRLAMELAIPSRKVLSVTSAP